MKEMINKKILLIILLLLVCGSLIGTGGLYLIRKLEPKPLYFGVAGPFSGEDAYYGREMRRGIDICLDKVNAKGGIEGRKIQYILGDDMNTSNFAMKVASSFAKKDVLFVLGHYSSLASIPAGRIYAKEGVPAVTASTPVDNVTQNNEWYFRTIPSASSQVNLIAPFVYNNLKQKSIVLIYSQDTYGQSFNTAFTDIAPKVNLSINETFAIDLEKPLMAQIFQICQRIKSNKYSGPVFLATKANLAVQLIKQLKLMNIQVTIIGANSISDESFYQVINELPLEKAMPGYYTDGIIATASDIFGNYLFNDESVLFYKHYYYRYKTPPTSIAAGYYDATLTMIDVLRQIETDENTTIEQFRRLIRRFLADINKPDYAVNGICGDIFFNNKGNVIKNTGIGQYNKGKLTPYHQQFVLNLESKETAYQELSVVVVKTNIRDIDIQDKKMTAHLILNFIYKNNTIDLSDIAFQNTAPIVKLGKPVDEFTKDGFLHKTYEIHATFDRNIIASNDLYPFDGKDLVISFHPQSPKGNGMRFSTQGHVQYDQNNLHFPGWHTKRIYAYGSVLKEENTPLFHIVVNLTRDCYPLLIQLFVSGLVILFLILSVYILSPLFYKTAFLILCSCLGLNTILYVHLREVTINTITPYDEWFIFLYVMIFLSLLMVFFIRRFNRIGQVKAMVWVKMMGAILHLGGLGCLFYSLRGVL